MSTSVMIPIDTIFNKTLYLSTSTRSSRLSLLWRFDPSHGTHVIPSAPYVVQMGFLLTVGKAPCYATTLATTCQLYHKGLLGLGTGMVVLRL